MVAMVACGPAPQPQPQLQPQPQPQPEPVMIESEIDPPFVAAKLGVPETCLGTPAKMPTPPPRSRKIYEFVSIEMPPVRWGPRIANMPMVGTRIRTTTSVSLARQARRRVLHDCYRWARWKQHDLAGTMTLTLDIGPTGDVTRVGVDDAKRWGELASCVTDALPTVSSFAFVPVATQIQLPVTFTLSGQGPADKRPPRPAKVGRPKPDPACSVAPADGIDALSYASPLVEVNDFDEAQADIERQRAECKASGLKRCRIHRRIVVGRIGIPTAYGDHDKAMLRAYVNYNRGAFGACFAETRGEVGLLYDIAPNGTLASLTIEKSSGNAALDECVRAAMAEVRFPAAGGGQFVTVHMPFTAGADVAVPTAPAARDTVVAIETSAKAALDAGDGDTAVRRYAALARHEPTCLRRLDVLRAMMVARPWLDDAVMAAAQDVVASGPTGACAAQSRPVLVALAIVPHRNGVKLADAALIETAIHRYELPLRIPELPDAAEVRSYLAAALDVLGRDTGGIEPKEPKAPMAPR